MDLFSILKFLGCILTLCCKRPFAFGQKLDIMAYEYYRKFNNYLDIGECVFKMEEIERGRSQIRTCTLPSKPGTIQGGQKILNDTRNFEVTQLNDIFVFMGLCGAQTASTLGILLDGDCFAVEVASNLSFNKKTYTRAYVEYSRQGVDIHQEGNTFFPLEHHQEYNDAYYLRDRSYGILEILVVEMKFRRKVDVEIIKSSHFESVHMSAHMQHVQNEVGPPRSTKIIRVSSSENNFQVQRFRRNNFAHALASVRRYELDLYRIRAQAPHTRPHLNYGLLPYIQQPRALGLSTLSDSDDMLRWETATAIEVRINRGLLVYKQIKRQCKKAKLPICRTTRTVKRELRNMKVIVHDKRSRWSFLTSDEKISTNEIYTSRVRRIYKEMNKIRHKLRRWKTAKKKVSKRTKGGNNFRSW